MKWPMDFALQPCQRCGVDVAWEDAVPVVLVGEDGKEHPCVVHEDAGRCRLLLAILTDDDADSEPEA